MQCHTQKEVYLRGWYSKSRGYWFVKLSMSHHANCPNQHTWCNIQMQIFQIIEMTPLQNGWLILISCIAPILSRTKWREPLRQAGGLHPQEPSSTHARKGKRTSAESLVFLKMHDAKMRTPMLLSGQNARSISGGVWVIMNYHCSNYHRLPLLSIDQPLINLQATIEFQESLVACNPTKQI